MSSASSGQPVAIITGASTGIGFATAGALANIDHAVVITARNEERLDAAAEDIAEQTGAPVLPIVVDSANPADMQQLVDATIEQFGRLDVLVNNAGVAHTTSIEDSDSAAFLQTYILNVFSPAAAIRAAWPHLKESPRPVILNISSWAARDPYHGFFIYASSKAALSSLTRSAINDAKHDGFEMRAFSICPGAVETDLLRSVVDEEACPPEFCLTPNEVAALVAACAKGDLDEHSGQELYVRRDAAGAVQLEFASFLE